VSDGFNWGLRPGGGKPEPEPEKPREDEADEDPFAFLTQLEPTQAVPVQPTPTPAPTRPEPDLPPTEAMATPEQPYRPEPATTEPPLQPFVFTPPPVAPFRPPSQYPVGPPVVAPPSATPTQPPTSSTNTTSTAGIDAIFGASSFREYDDAPLLAQIPRPAALPSAPREPMGQAQRILLGVAAGLVAVLVLVLVFVIGTKSPGLIPQQTAAPSAAATTEPDAEPTEQAPPTAIVEPGDYAWNALFGGECLEPFTDAWQNTYTVVDCSTDHTGQLLVHGAFDDETFPGAVELATAADKACMSAKVIDYPAASEYDDIQISASYATTEQEWADGFTGYYCFASRTNGVLAGSIAVGVTPTPVATP
jgi:hypothetical protein